MCIVNVSYQCMYQRGSLVSSTNICNVSRINRPYLVFKFDYFDNILLSYCIRLAMYDLKCFIFTSLVFIPVFHDFLPNSLNELDITVL